VTESKISDEELAELVKWVDEDVSGLEKMNDLMRALLELQHRRQEAPNLAKPQMSAAMRIAFMAVNWIKQESAVDPFITAAPIDHSVRTTMRDAIIALAIQFGVVPA
jgi:hypothetical protein